LEKFVETNFQKNILIISCQEDKNKWDKFSKLGYKIYSPELIIRGGIYMKNRMKLQHFLTSPATKAGIR
jgi:hypothetical protein